MNRHIWCIETRVQSEITLINLNLNRHIWCIETNKNRKWYYPRISLNRHIWCIETFQMPISVLHYYCLNRHIWCIETVWVSSFYIFIKSWTDTYDVLKHCFLSPLVCPHQLEPTHMMYWNLYSLMKFSFSFSLNRHIWCIETCIVLWNLALALAWTDTYDVLKLDKKVEEIEKYRLNRHIWCIETTLLMHGKPLRLGLNRHIWCIETSFFAFCLLSRVALNRHIWCIETL